MHRIGSREFREKPPVIRIVRRKSDGAGEDLPGEVGALLALQEAGGEVAVFGEAGGEFVRAGGVPGVVARRGK